MCQVCDELLERLQDYKESVIRNQSELLEQLVKDSDTKEDIDVLEEISCISDVIDVVNPVQLKENDHDLHLSRDTIIEKQKPKIGRPKRRSIKAEISEKNTPLVEKKQPYTKRHPAITTAEQDRIIANFMTITCDICSFTFDSVLELISHTESKHENVKKFKTRCGACSNVFYNRNRLIEHVMYHLKPETFQCTECMKTFVNQRYLRIHSETHLRSNSQEFECKICTQRFKEEAKLNQHSLKHTRYEDRKFHCLECEKRFVNEKGLNNHVNLYHTNKTEYVCEICAKLFKRTYVLKKHIKLVHEKHPKVQCDHCAKFFASETSLNKHIKWIHDRSGSFQCPDCKHVAPNRIALSRHINFVHKEVSNKHVCQFCQKAVKTLQALRVSRVSRLGPKWYINVKQPLKLFLF